MDGKSKISHNSPQPVGCVFTTATRARGARSFLTHAATPQAERSEALVSRQAHATVTVLIFYFLSHIKKA